MERVRALAEFCRTTDWPYSYFDAELLQRAPEKLLPRLTAWLELDSPLSEQYQLFSQTGKARRGDTSERVRTGRIDPAKTDYSHIAIPDEALAAAREAYRACREEIVGRARDSVIV